MGVLDLFRLDDHTAIVTGSGQGLGKAMATAFAEAGANLVLADINLETAAQTAKEVERIGRRALPIKVDVGNREDIQRMVKTAVCEFGAIDILLNNAGINRRVPADRATEEDWREVVRIDLDAVFYCSQAVGREMIAQRKGNIINLASMSGIIINKDVPQAAYCAAKAGVISLTRSLAMEWVQYNIRVNSISPGMMMTPLVEADFVKNTVMRDLVVENTPMRRFGEPRELGPAAVFLASEASGFITGHNLVIDGGYTVW